MEAKRCRDCDQIKPHSAFWKSKASPDGRALYCKDCFGKRNAASYRGKQASQGKQTRPFKPRQSLPEGMKYCPRCEKAQPTANFGRNKAEKSGLTAYCKPCHTKATAENRRKNHGSERNYLLKLRYGLTESEVDQVVRRQGGVCVVCLDAAPVHVDHDHVTRRFRGVLCFPCNGGLGQFDDDIWRITEAADYLENRTWFADLLRLELGTANLDLPTLRRLVSSFPQRADSVVAGPEDLRHRRVLGGRHVLALHGLQKGLCAICCDRPGDNVDHCHSTGALRGLLCGGCNTGMGQLRDDPAVLRRAAAYLSQTLVSEVATEAGGTRLSFTVPDVDPAAVSDWAGVRRADAEARLGVREAEGPREGWIKVPAGAV